jgi:acetoacetate decarboxylase
VSESTALMAGREGYGFPKKMGSISFVRHEDVMAMYYERPRGIRLASAVLRELSPVDPQSVPTLLRGINLRVIMSPEKDTKYSLADLVLGELEIRCKEVWMAEGNCSYSALSELDPWHRLPVKKHLGCTRMNFDIDLRDARIIATL